MANEDDFRGGRGLTDTESTGLGGRLGVLEAASATAATDVAALEARVGDTEVFPVVPSYGVATVPAATTAAGLIFVTDDVGGATMAFSDGTNWRRMSDRAIVSLS